METGPQFIFLRAFHISRIKAFPLSLILQSISIEHVLYVFVGALDDLIKDPPIRLAVNVNVNVSYNKKKNQKYIQNIAADFTNDQRNLSYSMPFLISHKFLQRNVLNLCLSPPGSCAHGKPRKIIQVSLLLFCFIFTSLSGWLIGTMD